MKRVALLHLETYQNLAVRLYQWISMVDVADWSEPIRFKIMKFKRGLGRNLIGWSVCHAVDWVFWQNFFSQTGKISTAARIVSVACAA